MCREPHSLILYRHRDFLLFLAFVCVERVICQVYQAQFWQGQMNPTSVRATRQPTPLPIPPPPARIFPRGYGPFSSSPGEHLLPVYRMGAAEGRSRIGEVAYTPDSSLASNSNNSKNGSGGGIADAAAHGAASAGGEAPRLVPHDRSTNTVGGRPCKNFHGVVVTGEEGEVPRKPLDVFPVEPQMVAGRSRPGCWKIDDRMPQQEKGEEEEEDSVCGLSGGDGGSRGSTAAVKPSRFVALTERVESTTTAVEPADSSHSSCCSAGSYMSPRCMVVRIDALYALQGRSECFGGKSLRSRDGSGGGGGVVADDGDGPLAEGNGLYLVLDNRRLTHRTVVRQRHREGGRADLDGHSRSRTPPPANEGQQRTVHDEWDSGGRRSVNHPALAADAWVFHETIALPIETAKGGGVNGGDQEKGLRLPDHRENGDNNDDDLLRVRVYTAGEFQPSAGFSRCASPSRPGTPAHQRTDAAAAAAGTTAVPDEVVGSATIPLRRHLTTTPGGGDRSSGGRRTNCTFSRLMNVSIVSPEGEAIGWIGFHVCAT